MENLNLKVKASYCQAMDFNSASIDFPEFLPEFGSIGWRRGMKVEIFW